LVEIKRISLVKPTINTPFHIDFKWWSRHERDWHVFLHSYLCPEHKEKFRDLTEENFVDWIDPETAEVKRVDELQFTLITHCAKEPSFITYQTTLVDSVFRLFLSNGNVPMSAIEIGEQLGRDANTILRTLSGTRVYRGIRPLIN